MPDVITLLQKNIEECDCGMACTFCPIDQQAIDEINRLRNIIVKGYGTLHTETKTAKNEQERKRRRTQRHQEYQEFCAEARKWLTS